MQIHIVDSISKTKLIHCTRTNIVNILQIWNIARLPYFWIVMLFNFLSSLHVSTKMSKRRLCQCRMQVCMPWRFYWDLLWNNNHKPWFVVFISCLFLIFVPLELLSKSIAILFVELNFKLILKCIEMSFSIRLFSYLRLWWIYTP